MNEQKTIPDLVFYIVWPITLTIINVVGFFTLKLFSVKLISLFGLNNASADIQSLSSLIIMFGIFILSIILTGTAVIQLKERNTKISLSNAEGIFDAKLTEINSNLETAQNDISARLDKTDAIFSSVTSAIETHLKEFIQRKVSVLQLEGNVKGSLVYYVKPKIPIELNTMEVKNSKYSYEVLSIDHFQDVLLNVVYLEYFFKRIKNTEERTRLIITRESADFINSYLKLCWGTGFNVFLINKIRYHSLIEEMVRKKRLTGNKKDLALEVLTGNLVVELDENNTIVSLKYKDKAGKVIELEDECKDSLDTDILSILKDILSVSFSAKENLSDESIMQALKP